MGVNILKPHIQISKLTISLGIFIIISASFTKQLIDFAKAHIGERWLIVLFGLFFLIDGLFFLVFVIRENHGLTKILVITLVLIAGLTLAWQARILVEKIHVLEYGLLGWFTGKDLIRTGGNKFKGVILAFIFTAFIGILDEGFQRILPYRVFELRDIMMNILGGGWGVILYLLNYR